VRSASRGSRPRATASEAQLSSRSATPPPACATCGGWRLQRWPDRRCGALSGRANQVRSQGASLWDARYSSTSASRDWSAACTGCRRSRPGAARCLLGSPQRDLGGRARPEALRAGRVPYLGYRAGRAAPRRAGCRLPLHGTGARVTRSSRARLGVGGCRCERSPGSRRRHGYGPGAEGRAWWGEPPVSPESGAAGGRPQVRAGGYG
jgi:hypothetical protein